MRHGSMKPIAKERCRGGATNASMAITFRRITVSDNAIQEIGGPNITPASVNPTNVTNASNSRSESRNCSLSCRSNEEPLVMDERQS